MYAKSRLAACLIVGAGLAAAASPTFGTGEACGGDQSCTVPCPAANTCALELQNCPAGMTCVRYTGAPWQNCRPGGCGCYRESWACTDDCAPQCEAVGVSGVVPDGRSGPPLTASRIGSALRLDWGESCPAGDVDYEVYEGRLDLLAFSLHPVLCSTGGTSATFGPASGNSYYLVVPTNGIIEGSYGQDSAGREREPNWDPCRPQSAVACSP